MKKAEILKKLPGVLIPWYHDNKRDLPWRADRDPYHIWLSEIMLQQTRVETVRDYYTRFLNKIPDIATLANVDDELLHKLWEGLGYYSRVRNLKKAAVAVMAQHGGVFPDGYEELLSLPGIGEYTAGAICSIAYNQKTPAVDGNVLRVISRITNDASPIDLPATKKLVCEQLATVYPDEAGDFTQALMELGATVCVPNGAPNCGWCPCETFCVSRQKGTSESLPVKSPKKKRRKEEMTVLILRCEDRFGIEKRANEGLLAGLWQFPNFPGKTSIDQVIFKVEKMGLKPKEILRTVEKKHIFTHVEWDMSGIYMEVARTAEHFAWLTAEEINRNTALPTAFRQFWEEINYV